MCVVEWHLHPLLVVTPCNFPSFSPPSSLKPSYVESTPFYFVLVPHFHVINLFPLHPLFHHRLCPFGHSTLARIPLSFSFFLTLSLFQHPKINTRTRFLPPSPSLYTAISMRAIYVYKKCTRACIYKNVCRNFFSFFYHHSIPTRHVFFTMPTFRDYVNSSANSISQYIT